ncbi:ATP-dependent dethiobiotin synthetase BioD [Arthrobacter psychrolactophilus]
MVVCRSGLGTLNHTLLTLEALAVRGLRAAGLVIGSWPHDADEVELDNKEYLSRLAVPLLGCLPERASLLSSDNFRASAPEWLAIRSS